MGPPCPVPHSPMLSLRSRKRQLWPGRQAADRALYRAGRVRWGWWSEPQHGPAGWHRSWERVLCLPLPQALSHTSCSAPVTRSRSSLGKQHLMLTVISPPPRPADKYSDQGLS